MAGAGASHANQPESAENAKCAQHGAECGGATGVVTGDDATVVERTGGVPLFVEELTRAVLEGGRPSRPGAKFR